MLGAFKDRLAATEDLVGGANVDGVILQNIVFCDSHAVESTMLAEELEPTGIPVLVLEREHVLSDIGRLKTRILAFIERLSRRQSA
jgi:benzoyl-CoA reductase/2-hydroxyglutaryl-CoA dehydratase subunit BcrC/BadD/HgdB